MNLSVVGEEFYTDLENEIDYLKREHMAMRDHTQSLNYAMDDMERIVYTLQEENIALQEDNNRVQKEETEKIAKKWKQIVMELEAKSTVLKMVQTISAKIKIDKIKR